MHVFLSFGKALRNGMVVSSASSVFSLRETVLQDGCVILRPSPHGAWEAQLLQTLANA